MQKRLLFAVMMVVLLFSAACTFPVDFFRPPEEVSLPDDQVALTVTSVLATNTQIAILRTGTAVAAVGMGTPPAAGALPTITPAAAVPSVTPIPPTAAPPTAPPVQAGDVMLMYNPTSFTLLNMTGGSLDIAGLTFHSDTGNFEAVRWDNGFLSASLYTFPPQDCLMLWPVGTAMQPKPAECDTRHAWLGVNELQTFWLTAGMFEVRYYGQTLGMCAGTATSCVVDLP